MRLNLKSILINTEVQSMLEDFSYLTGVATAILDLEGNVLISTGWQGICRDFHRKHPETQKHCLHSDLSLSKNCNQGEYLEYRCKNGLWDVITPFFIGSQHIGNVYTGQFFYDDDVPEESFFRAQARKYDFVEEEYLAAYQSIPRFSHEKIRRVMSYLIKLTTYISKMSILIDENEMEIQERKHAEQALHQSESQMRSVIRAIPDLIWLKDQQGVYLSCNTRFEEFFGAKEEVIRGKTDYDFVDKELADFFRKHDRIAMKKGGPSRNEEQVTFAVDGHKEILETIKTPLVGNDGQITGVLGIGRDITQRKQLEEERLELEQQYQQVQKVESIGRLAGGVAHDLNNLLSPILGYSELLLKDLGSDYSRRDYIDQILSAGFRARDLVRQLLAFSRKQTLKYQPVDLNNTIRGFEDLLRRTIREDTYIETVLSPCLPVVMADIGQIEQVILNLALNASDAMPQGGFLTITTEQVEVEVNNPVTKKTGLKPGDYILMTVTDSGKGIDKTVLPHIFEPFFTTKGDDGVGLGLSTAYGIVKQHGGHITVESSLEIGTKFKIYLPVTENHSKDTKGVQRQNDLVPTGSETILIVEDNPPVRYLAEAILRRQGYTLILAENGQEALELLSKSKFRIDLLLTDLVMPGMSGVELYEKTTAINPDIKVVFMSGYTGDVVNHGGVLDEGVNFIQKPFSVDTLCLKVREVLDRPE